MVPVALVQYDKTAINIITLSSTPAAATVSFKAPEHICDIQKTDTKIVG